MLLIHFQPTGKDKWTVRNGEITIAEIAKRGRFVSVKHSRGIGELELHAVNYFVAGVGRFCDTLTHATV
jgi:hypothetical protein